MRTTEIDGSLHHGLVRAQRGCHDLPLPFNSGFAVELKKRVSVALLPCIEHRPHSSFPRRLVSPSSPHRRLSRRRMDAAFLSLPDLSHRFCESPSTSSQLRRLSALTGLMSSRGAPTVRIDDVMRARGEATDPGVLETLVALRLARVSRGRLVCGPCALGSRSLLRRIS